MWIDGVKRLLFIRSEVFSFQARVLSLLRFTSLILACWLITIHIKDRQTDLIARITELREWLLLVNCASLKTKVSVTKATTL